MRPASILERSRTLLMRRKRCFPLFWMSVSGSFRSGGTVPVDPAQDHLVEPEDRVQRRPELVGHVGEELGLVAAGRLELLALVRDLSEQAGVLDGQRRLRREGLQDVDDLGRELPGRLPVEGQAADDLILAQQRHGEERAVAEPDERVADAALVRVRLGDVGNLEGLTDLSGASHEAFTLRQGHRPNRFHERRVQIVGRAEMKLLGPLVVLVDGAAVRSRRADWRARRSCPAPPRRPTSS